MAGSSTTQDDQRIYAIKGSSTDIWESTWTFEGMSCCFSRHQFIRTDRNLKVKLLFQTIMTGPLTQLFWFYLLGSISCTQALSGHSSVSGLRTLPPLALSIVNWSVSVPQWIHYCDHCWRCLWDLMPCLCLGGCGCRRRRGTRCCHLCCFSLKLTTKRSDLQRPSTMVERLGSLVRHFDSATSTVTNYYFLHSLCVKLRNKQLLSR